MSDGYLYSLPPGSDVAPDLPAVNLPSGGADRAPLRVTVGPKPSAPAAADPWAAFPKAPPPAAEAGATSDPWAAFPTEPPPPGPADKKPFGITDTWPFRLAHAAGEQIANAVTLPGRVNSGEVQIGGENGEPFNPEVIKGAADMAMLANPVNPGIRAGDKFFAGEVRRVAPEARAAPMAAQAAEDIGVNLPKAIASDSTLTRFMGQASAKMPGGGPMLAGVKQAVDQTGEAVATAAGMAGGTADLAAAGQGFKAGIKNYFEPGVTKRINEAYDAVGGMLDKSATTELPATSRLFSELAAARAARGKGTSPAMKVVEPALETKAITAPELPSGRITAEQYQNYIKATTDAAAGKGQPAKLTYDAIKNLRTDVGEQLAKTPDGTSKTELKRLYGALSEDLKSHVSAVGGPKALALFERANALNKTVEEWRESLKTILGNERSDEGVAAAILRAAQNGPSGNAVALAKARAAVPPEVWQDVASTAISQLGRNVKNEFSPAQFMRDYAGREGLSDRGKLLLFRTVGAEALIPFLDNIAKVSQKLVKAGELANTSGTAGNLAAVSIIGSVPTGIGVGMGTGSVTGAIIPPLVAIGQVIGNNLLARALANKATAASMARWSRAYEGLVMNPGPNAMAVFNITSRNLANTLNGVVGSYATNADFLKAIKGIPVLEDAAKRYKKPQDTPPPVQPMPPWRPSSPPNFT